MGYPKPRRLFLDMDGILADFVSGACLAHNRPNPYLDDSSLGFFDMEKLWQIPATEFWSAIDAKTDFWDTLLKTPEADQIVEMALQIFGKENVAVLSAPSMDPTCVPGKRRWMQKHYPQLASRMIFAAAQAKQFLANPSCVLIDDRDENVEEFKRSGGIGILMPRPWNDRHHLSKRAFAEVEESLHRIMKTANVNDT